MTSVRLAVCSAFAAALLLPAVAAAQGPNHGPGGSSPPPPPPPVAPTAPPCWSSGEAAECLKDRLKGEVAEHRLSHAKAAVLRRRIEAARLQEKKALQAYKRIDAALDRR